MIPRSPLCYFRISVSGFSVMIFSHSFKVYALIFVGEDVFPPSWTRLLLYFLQDLCYYWCTNCPTGAFSSVRCPYLRRVISCFREMADGANSVFPMCWLEGYFCVLDTNSSLSVSYTSVGTCFSLTLAN